MQAHNIKALIFDRDGTLIEHIPYLSNPNAVKLLPGVKEGMKILKSLNYIFFLHTNQSGVGRNYFSIHDVHSCNNRMIELLELEINLFERVCIATEVPSDPIQYRKPSSLFAKDLMDFYGFSANEMCFIGDRSTDLQVAIELGASAIGINTGLVDLKEELKGLNGAEDIPIFDSFTKVVDYLI